MHWLDTTLLAFFGVASVLGFVTGFFWQVARIFGLVVAVWASVQLHTPVTGVLQSSILKGVEPAVAAAVGYIVVFVAVYIVVYLLARSMREFLKTAGLDFVDRVLGSCLSLFKMSLILGGVCLLLTRIPHSAPQGWMKESAVAPVLAKGMERALVLVPEDYRKSLTTPE